MSSYYFRTFGYGIQVSELKEVSMSKLVELIQTAPKFAHEYNAWMKENGVEEPTLDDLKEFDDDYCLGLSTVLSAVINECENMCFLTSCGDLDGESYLLYTPSYPWQMNEKEKNFTPTDIETILTKYISKITDEAITIDYYDPEDGG